MLVPYEWHRCRAHLSKMPLQYPDGKKESSRNPAMWFGLVHLIRHIPSCNMTPCPPPITGFLSAGDERQSRAWRLNIDLPWQHPTPVLRMPIAWSPLVFFANIRILSLPSKSDGTLPRLLAGCLTEPKRSLGNTPSPILINASHWRENSRLFAKPRHQGSLSNQVPAQRLRAVVYLTSRAQPCQVNPGLVPKSLG